jgi:hypothetical protein
VEGRELTDVTLYVRLFGVSVRISTPTPEAHRRLRFCYSAMAGLPAALEGAIEARIDPDGSGFTIRVPGRTDGTAPDVSGAIRIMNHELLHAAMLRASHLFYVHAGVVAASGRAVILPGLSRAGKSTLVLALLDLGTDLLSDELLVFDPQSSRVLAFPRAIKIRDECVPHFRQWTRWFEGEGETRFLDLGSLRGRIGADAFPWAIVIPHWDPEGDDRPRPITRGEAFLALTASALNFGTHRTESLAHLVRICENTRTFALSWRDPHAAAAGILDAVRKDGA